MRRAQRRLHESLCLLDHALPIAEPESLGRLWVKRAKTLEELGRNEEAIEDLRRAVGAIGPEADPRLAWAVRFNLVVNLCALEVDREALAALKVFCAAAETEAVTLAEARRVRDVLQRGGSAPGPAAT